MKKPILVYVIADQNNYPYALKMLKSLYYFHPDWPVFLYTNEVKKEELAKLPKTVEIQDLNPLLIDPNFFYRATPVLGEKLLDEYELIVKIDADSVILGDLSYLLKRKDYDIATVINYNRFDEKFMPMPHLMQIGIMPIEYFNCGFVAMRSKRFVHHWLVECFTNQYDRMQYKEQDILNVLCYLGNYNVLCLDHPDIKPEQFNKAWWGILGKGEWVRAFRKDDKIYIPKGEGSTPFPPDEMEIKVAHWAGGNMGGKCNWAQLCSPDMLERINEVTK